MTVLACVICFGQTSYKGLTPGKSTRADVEAVFGLPVRSVSKTLIEYKSPEYIGKVYVQYRDESAAAIVERLELTCVATGNDPCWLRYRSMTDKYLTNEGLADTRNHAGEGGINFKSVYWFGASRFMVVTFAEHDEVRVAFYSKELYETVAPKPQGCTGTIFGDWETNHGRMTVVRVGDLERDGMFTKTLVKGTYSTNNGTFTGELSSIGYMYAEWKDDTGTGKMKISVVNDKLNGDWERTTGTAPPKGSWEGHCVEVRGGGNNSRGENVTP